ncbi:hypothetical protein EDB81DRAFT_452595 [Dactylonectria macrodidyma]|uniref:Uncharacterized protein n=1 Tax=Dactylonectria macrodidyma TaxID=307937 RepID=A0A9P9F5N1_9HYPO|nr:hypothetical protein EDB81DRAFT_452595 [Dactylonectria macrodidyma]
MLCCIHCLIFLRRCQPRLVGTGRRLGEIQATPSTSKDELLQDKSKDKMELAHNGRLPCEGCLGSRAQQKWSPLDDHRPPPTTTSSPLGPPVLFISIRGSKGVISSKVG